MDAHRIGRPQLLALLHELADAPGEWVSVYLKPSTVTSRQARPVLDSRVDPLLLDAAAAMEDDEVQRLAERSANATRQIEFLVRTIQADTNEAIVSMERSTTDVVGGALLAENAGAALEEIEQVSNQIAALVQNISSSAREQGKAASAVTRSMDVLEEINAETQANTSATTSAISKLAELATQLRRSVAGFRLPPVAALAQAGSPAAAVDAAPAEAAREPAAHFAEPVSFASKRTA